MEILMGTVFENFLGVVLQNCESPVHHFLSGKLATAEVWF